MKTALPLLLLALLPLSAEELEGIIDIHVHAAPDIVPRSVDVFEAAKLARENGLRAIVLKNHYEPTASLALLARRQQPGLQVFGGIALNRAVGGVNPAAVERMARLPGQAGKLVWMPTFDSEHAVSESGESRPFVPVSRNGELLPEVFEVLDLIAKHDLALATGHSSPEECQMLIREAQARGAKRIVVTHAMMPPIRMNAGQMQQAARAGAQIEFAYNGVIGADSPLTMQDYVDAIRAVGPDSCILSSDLGQASNPLPPDGFRRFLGELRKHGFSQRELDVMTKTNPARLLGIE